VIIALLIADGIIDVAEEVDAEAIAMGSRDEFRGSGVGEGEPYGSTAHRPATGSRQVAVVATTRCVTLGVSPPPLREAGQVVLRHSERVGNQEVGVIKVAITPYAGVAAARASCRGGPRAAATRPPP
jgi:hypothetical protein